MNKTKLGFTALLGALAIVLGAFASHGLKGTLEPEQLNSFQTGVRYHLFHVLFLLLLVQLPGITDKTKSILFTLIVFGIILFSGSIYLLTTEKVTGLDISTLGWITPIGGTLLISAWLVLAFRYFSSKSDT